MAGSTPAASSVDDLLSAAPSSRRGLPGRASGATRSAAHLHPMGGVARDRLRQGPSDRRRAAGSACADKLRRTSRRPRVAAAQAEHLKRLRAINRYPGPVVHERRQPRRANFRTAVIDALVKAAAKPTRQPRNLPFASLGACSRGATTELEELARGARSGKGAAVVGTGAARARRRRQDAARDRIRAGATRRTIRRSCSCAPTIAATLNANLAALAGAAVLDLPEKEAREDAAKIEAVLHWLEAHPTWLMILDNVDDEEAVKAVTELMPRLKGGHVIVTARAANFPASMRKLELDVLDEDAATRISSGAHARRSRQPRPTTRRKPASSRANSAASRSGSNRPAPISRRSASASRAISKLWNENRESVLTGSTRRR